MTGQQLKNSILQMAVQGKLVPQDPNDEPASVLLERIRAEKEQLIKEKKIKKEKNPSVIFRGADNLPYEKVGKNAPVCIADEVPFEIPESWEWVHLSDIAISGLGKTLNKSIDEGTDTPYLCSINVYWTGIDLSTIKMAKFTQTDREKYLLQKGDLLICEGGDVGRSAIWNYDREMYYQNALHRVRFLGKINPYFFLYLLECYKGLKIIEEYSKGVTIKHFVQSSLNAMFLPLPPLNEQQRIVDKINEIIPVVAKYDIIYSKVAKLNDTFPETLKRSILQWTVQGKLVPQDPADEPAEALLKRIREEKQQLIKEGKIKKDKHKSVIFRRDNSHYEKLDGVERCIDDELPFEVPEKWVWARLSMVGITQTGNTPSTAHPEYRGNDTPFITPGDLLNGIISYENQGLSKKGTDVARICAKESILQVCIGGSIGKAAITNRQVAFNQQINAITPFLDSAYTLAVLSSFWFLSEMKSQAGGTATPILNRGLWDRMLIPVPPYSEQKRIAAKIEELLPLLNGL